jgi:hypothetical protein
MPRSIALQASSQPGVLGEGCCNAVLLLERGRRVQTKALGMRAGGLPVTMCRIVVPRRSSDAVLGTGRKERSQSR